jgi:hypothetical protein
MHKHFTTKAIAYVNELFNLISYIFPNRWKLAEVTKLKKLGNFVRLSSHKTLLWQSIECLILARLKNLAKRKNIIPECQLVRMLRLSKCVTKAFNDRKYTAIISRKHSIRFDTEDFSTNWSSLTFLCP